MILHALRSFRSINSILHTGWGAAVSTCAPVVIRLNKLVLEDNRAFLMPPPVGDPVFFWFDRTKMDLHTGALQLLPEKPAHAAGNYDVQIPRLARQSSTAPTA